MSDKILLYSDLKNNEITISLLSQCVILENHINEIYKANHRNKNILILTTKNINKEKIEKIIETNNVLIFYSNTDNNKENDKLYLKAPISIKKFYNFVTDFFKSGSKNYLDIKLDGEKITNIKNNKYCYLTALEKKIILELFDKKNLNKEYVKEKILEVNKNVETKTVESHFSRIRKKLLEIDSNIKISSKDNNFFLKIS